MYNLFVCANDDSWNGEPWDIETSRCVSQYTDDNITNKWGDLSVESLNELKGFPCIFAYENSCKKDPLFGFIREAISRQGLVRITYEIFELDQFISYKDMEELGFELDIAKYEMNRTHWAVKDVDLAKELSSKNITLPQRVSTSPHSISPSIPKTKKVPKVFLSYSHDSSDHKEWVLYLAEQLIGIGIDVVLDQWNLGPGSDVLNFMSKSVSESDRVIMICTPNYVEKSNEAQGGAGYETMIVTGELIKNLGTTKFIPVIRQDVDSPPQVPSFMGTRHYVDFSRDEKFDYALEELGRDIHESPRRVKPALGSNPFKNKTRPLSVSSKEPLLDDAYSVYQTALKYAQDDKISGWNKLLRDVKDLADANLNDWRTRKNLPLPANPSELGNHFFPAVEFYNPLIAMAMAGLESENPRFEQHLKILTSVRSPKGWNGNGLTTIVDLPEFIVFYAHSILGSFAMSKEQPQVAKDIGTLELTNNRSNEKAPLFKHYKFTGWPDSLGHNCGNTIAFIQNKLPQQEWLQNIIGDEESILAAFGSYYSLLNIIDYISASRSAILESKDTPRVPVFTFPLGTQVEDLVGSSMHNISEYLEGLFERNGITMDTLEEEWPRWTSRCALWCWDVYKTRNGTLPHRDLPEWLNKQSSGLDII